ncbi:MAG: hypothetical protein QOF80_2175 [Verrucomicrobiota bacterium]|jgi:hypothetical protein
MFAFPNRLERYVASDNPRADIFLKNKLRFQFEDAISDLDFFVNRNADRIDNGVGQVVDEFDGSIGIGEAGMFRIPGIDPISEIETGLELFVTPNSSSCRKATSSERAGLLARLQVIHFSVSTLPGAEVVAS